MKTYDVIVVGAGHNGLVAAAYLARAGLRVAVVESRSEVGGTFQTIRSPLGVGHNLHAVHLKFHLAPYEADLALSEAGAEFVYPSVKVGFGFADHSAFGLYVDPDNTTASLGRISSADAERFAAILPTWKRWFEEIVRPSVFSPPCDETGYVARLASSRYTDLRQVLTLTPAEYARTVFSDTRARRILTWALGAQGYLDDYRTMPPIVLFTAFAHLLFPMSLACGGTARVAEALSRRVQSFDGDVLVGTGVRKIQTSGGRAIGVELNDGCELKARHCILSAVNPAITFGELLIDEPIPKHVRTCVGRMQWDEWSLFGVHLVLRDPPRHLFDEPNFDQAVKYVLPGDDTDDIPTSRILRERRLRPVPRMGAGCLSLHDPSLRAGALHSAYAWEQVPYYLANATWDSIREQRLAECLQQWRNVAPNLTADNIVEAFAYTPQDIVHSMPNLVEGGLNVGRITPPQVGTARPAPGLGGYRTCVDGLYLCGASCHPGGGATGAPGYVAARIVAEDLKLTPWWTHSFDGS